MHSDQIPSSIPHHRFARYGLGRLVPLLAAAAMTFPAVPTNAADRVEQGVLGEYALGFGKGYFIHGTLYTRLLGKNVTHGCIRLLVRRLSAATLT